MSIQTLSIFICFSFSLCFSFLQLFDLLLILFLVLLLPVFQLLLIVLRFLLILHTPPVFLGSFGSWLSLADSAPHLFTKLKEGFLFVCLFNLSASGLSCSTWDLCCIMQDLSLLCTGSLAVALGPSAGQYAES